MTKKEKSKFEEIWLEIGLDCNLKCSYCFNSADGVKDEEGTLNIEDYMNLLAQFKSMGGKVVGMPGAGEPLFGRNLETTLEIFGFCYEHDLRLNIFTNAQQLNDKLIERLNEDNVALMVKFNSFIPEIQDKLVGVKGYTKRRARNIQKLMEAGFNDGSRMSFITPILNVNYDEIPIIFRYCRDNGIIPDMDTVLELGRGASCRLSREDTKNKEMFEILQKIDREEYGNEWVISPTYIADCCDRYERHLYINRFGDIAPCLGANLKEVKLGNIKTDNLESCWESALMKKVRDRDYEGECTDCKSFVDKECNSCLGRYADKITLDEIHTIACWNKKEAKE